MPHPAPFKRLAAIALAASLGACAGTTNEAPPLSASGASSHAAAQRNDRREGRLRIRIRIPKERRHAHGSHYISAATKGMTMAFTGPTTLAQVINLTPSDPRCTGSPLTCTIVESLAPGSYTVTVNTYDKAPASGAIPAGANVLSTANNVPLSVNLGEANAFDVTLDGVPANLVVSGLPAGAASTAFASPQPFTVTAKDADGDTIVGTYTTPITLATTDATGATTIATAGTDGPSSGDLLSSADTATLNYSGRGILPATITASAAGATGGSAIFAPSGVAIVTLNTDSAPGATPGICPAGTSGDLRYAMCNASAGGWIFFNCGDPCTIALDAPLPPIDQNLTVDGGSIGSVIIDGAHAYRAFFVDTGTVTLRDLQVQNAAAIGGSGGGGGGAGLGAGLFVNQAGATVSASGVYFLSDAAIGGAGGGGGGLGGNGGSNNTVSNGGGGGGGQGGAGGMGSVGPPPGSTGATGTAGEGGAGGVLATLTGGNGASDGNAGGGAAAGPAIFVNAGTLTTTDSGAHGSSATGGAAGGAATAGGADATPVFNYAGTVNGSTTTGPISSALSASEPSIRRRAHTRIRHVLKIVTR